MRSVWKTCSFVRKIGSEEANKYLAEHSGGEGFKNLFDGKSLAGWDGAKDNYEVVDGAIQCKSVTVAYCAQKTCTKIRGVPRVQVATGGNNGLAILLSRQGR